MVNAQMGSDLRSTDHQKWKFNAKFGKKYRFESRLLDLERLRYFILPNSANIIKFVIDQSQLLQLNLASMPAAKDRPTLEDIKAKMHMPLNDACRGTTQSTNDRRTGSVQNYSQATMSSLWNQPLAVRICVTNLVSRRVAKNNVMLKFKRRSTRELLIFTWK
jgi:hypothetical protein